MSKILIIIGLSLASCGIILHYFPTAFSWIGKLPGDLRYRSSNFAFYFPLATCILASLVLSFLFWIVRRFL